MSEILLYDCNGEKLKLRPKSAFPWRIGLLATTVAFLQVATMLLHFSHRHPPKIAIADTVADQPASAADQELLDWGLHQWRVALHGPLWISRPALVRGRCDGDPTCMACANAQANKITLVAFKESYAKTVMLHEIAHLLGVPHIEGDPLMDWSQAQPMEEPSPYAIAIARSNIRLVIEFKGVPK